MKTKLALVVILQQLIFGCSSKSPCDSISKNICLIKNGMKYNQVVSLIGRPAGVYAVRTNLSNYLVAHYDVVIGSEVLQYNFSQDSVLIGNDSLFKDFCCKIP